jgi:hypothetical protein
MLPFRGGQFFDWGSGPVLQELKFPFENNVVGARKSGPADSAGARRKACFALSVVAS